MACRGWHAGLWVPAGQSVPAEQNRLAPGEESDAEVALTEPENAVPDPLGPSTGGVKFDQFLS